MLHRTTCNRDCPDACSILVEVQGGRVMSLKGDPQHPVTQGFLCPRTAHFLERQYHPSRFLHPLLKVGDRQVEIPWDQAMDLAAERLKAVLAQSGPAAVFPYRLGGSLGLLQELTDHFFDQLGPITRKTGDICSAAGESAQMDDFGVLDTHDRLDLLNARHILNWGRNPAVTSVHTVPILVEARKRGARVTLVDPLCTESHPFADTWLPVRPGGDGALALAVARRLFDMGRASLEGLENGAAYKELVYAHPLDSLLYRCDLPMEAVDHLARALADGPTAILVGWGLQRRRDGTATVRLLDALGAISGNLGRPGGGVSFTVTRKAAFNLGFRRSGATARTIREPFFAQDLVEARDPPVRFLWVSCANPIAMLPDSEAVARAIEGVEFSVVVDTHPTDTTRRASLVLPCVTLLEDDDLLGSYGHHGVALSEPAVPPPGDARTDLQILQELARRMGLEASVEGTAREWKTRLLQDRKPDLATLEAGPAEVPHPQVLQVPHVRLITELPALPPLDPGFPLWLFAVSHRGSQASQWVSPPQGPLPATLHPDAAPGLEDGQRAWLQSPIGSLEVVIRHDPRQRRDVVLVPKGGHLDRGQAVNALIPARGTDRGDGAACFDVKVRVRGA